MDRNSVIQSAGTYFGLPDAAHESPKNILEDHVPRDIDRVLKMRDRTDGKQILVGIKGSGKTTIHRFIEQQDKTAIVWNIDTEHRYLDIDPHSLNGRSGVIKNMIALELLRAFASHVAHEASTLGLKPKVAEAFRSVGQRVLDGLKNIPDAVQVGTGPVSVDLAKLLKTRAAPIVNTTWLDTIKGVLEALSSQRAYIMIDDAEDVFPGLESNPTFIEGLARAVHDINLTSGSRIHTLLFLKYGVWRKWFENQQEYDRVEHVVREITWDHDGLCSLVARRVARIHGIELGEKIDVPALWSKEFIWDKSQSFDEFAQEFTRLCVCGPRDMVVLANRAKAAAGKDRIRIEHLKSQIDRYSESKLYEINADFGGVYEEVVKFVDNVFRGCPAEMTGQQAADWIEKHGLTSPKVDDYFKKHQWYATASKERLVARMYEIGLWGVRTAGGYIVSSIERPTITPEEITSASVVIHPAFRSHLGITEKSQVKVKKNTNGAKKRSK